MAVNTTFVDGTTTILSTWLNWANQVINGIAGIGYLLSGAGIGADLFQTVNKTNGVSSNTYCGRVLTAASALASGATTSFLFTTNKIGTYDTVHLTLGVSAQTPGAYNVWAEVVYGTGFTIYIKNVSGGSLSESVPIHYSIVKGVGS